MQVICSHGWDLQLGDIRGAFLEAGPLPERFRPLFAKQPQGGIPGVEADAVLEMVWECLRTERRSVRMAQGFRPSRHQHWLGKVHLRLLSLFSS